MEVFILAGVFFCISTVFSMLGMGGGILYVPILLFAGFSFRQAPAISLILILATSSAALFNYWRNKKVDWKLALLIDPPTDIMAFFGGYFCNLVPEPILHGCLAVILVIAGVLMQKKIKSRPPALSGEKKWYYWLRHFREDDYHVNIPVVLSATAAIGIISGMLGISGGIIKLPIMILLCGVPMDVAVATSTVMVAFTALSGLIGHALNENIEWTTGLILAVTAVLGGLTGSKMSLKTDKILLKRIFGIVLILISIKFIIGLIP